MNGDIVRISWNSSEASRHCCLCNLIPGLVSCSGNGDCYLMQQPIPSLVSCSGSGTAISCNSQYQASSAVLGVGLLSHATLNVPHLPHGILLCWLFHWLGGDEGRELVVVIILLLHQLGQRVSTVEGRKLNRDRSRASGLDCVQLFFSTLAFPVTHTYTLP